MYLRVQFRYNFWSGVILEKKLFGIYVMWEMIKRSNFCLSVCLSVCLLSVCLFIFCLCLCLSSVLKVENIWLTLKTTILFSGAYWLDLIVWNSSPVLFVLSPDSNMVWKKKISTLWPRTVSDSLPTRGDFDNISLHQ